MRVKIEEISRGSLDRTFPVTGALLDSAIADGGKAAEFRAQADAELSAKFTKMSSGVLLKGALTARLSAPCKRCVGEVKLEVPVEFTLNLVPQQLTQMSEEDEERTAAERGGSFGLEDADEEPFDGKTIDLDPIVREQVLLALPVSVVCREDCRGLCSICGQNLNEKECGCERKIPDPRLAKLKDIKLN